MTVPSMKYCKLCKKPANEVTLIHARYDHKGNILSSSLTPGYCTGCQDWLMMWFLAKLFIVIGVFVKTLEWLFA